MIEIEIKPIQKMIFYHVVKDEKNEFVTKINNEAINGNYIALVFWCDGLLLDFSFFDETEYIQKERTNGIIHCKQIRFAEMNQFVDKIELKNGGHILISDLSNDINIKEMVKELKK